MPRILAQLEGEIEDTPVLNAAGDAVFHVLGVKVVVKPSAATNRRIRTPTLQRSLSLQQLTKTTKLPGLDSTGFKGCTAIVVGNYVYGADQAGSPDLNALVVDYPITGLPDPALGLPFEYHPSLEIGPPESVLLGPLTAPLANDVLTVNGVEARLMPDDPDRRLTAYPPMNEFGILVNPAKVPLDTPISIDGYPSTVPGSKTFIGFKIMVDSPSPGILADPVNPRVGVTRAQARIGGGRIDYEIRGGLFTGRNPIPPGVQSVQVLGRLPDGTTTPIGQATAQAAVNDFDGWRLRVTLNPPAPIPVPAAIFAKFINSSIGEVVSLDEPLDVRDDPKAPPPP